MLVDPLRDAPLVLHSATSTTNPITFAEVCIFYTQLCMMVGVPCRLSDFILI